MIIERLYQGKGIPEGTRPDRIRQVQKVLETRLKNKMHQQYNWFAVATKAVEAGHWGGVRRIRARRKLADMIDECRVFLGKRPVERPKGWENYGLRFGYGACSRQDVMERFGTIEALVSFMLYFRTELGMEIPTSYRI